METMQEDGAELVGMTEGRGGDCGRGGASRRRQERSVGGNGEGESQGKGRRSGESERVLGARGDVLASKQRRKQEVARRVASTRSASFWRGGDDDWRRPAGLGRTVLGYLVGWQVGCAR